MAGLGGLADFIQYQGQLQQQSQDQQAARQKAVLFQQQQQAYQQQMAAQAAAGNALPQLLGAPPPQAGGGQAQPQQQTPQPGQSSQPQQQPPSPQQIYMAGAKAGAQHVMSQLQRPPAGAAPQQGAPQPQQGGAQPQQQPAPQQGQPQQQPNPLQQAYMAGAKAGAQHVIAQVQQSQQPQGGAASMPQGPVPGQVNRPPLPPGGAQGQVAPFQPMPTSPPPQQDAAPQGIAPPPAAGPQQQTQQPGPLTIQAAITALQAQGLKGADLMAGLAQLQPVLDTQAKQQNAQLQAQFNNEMKEAQVQDRRDALQERAREADQRSEDAKASVAERQQAAGEAAQARMQIAQLIAQTRMTTSGMAPGGAPPTDIKPGADGKLPAPPGVDGYSSEAIKALGEDYAIRGPQALSGFARSGFSPRARAEVINYAAAKNAQNGSNLATNKAQYAADTSAARVNANQAAKVDASANALVQPDGIGDQFQQSIDALDRTGVPIANQAQMAALRASNDPRVATYDTAQNGVVSEAAQILGRGTLTVNSMEEARRVVDGWHTSAQAKAGLAQLKREAATTVKASSEEVSKSAKTPKGQPGTASGAGGTVNWNDLK
jgi:hypothetical protein